jgi:two-component system osmolarity sensor histidine kinase EnvZ
MLWPKTLFFRLSLLMLAVLVLAQAVTWVSLRQERERRLANQFSQTKIAQIQGIRNALLSVPRGSRPSAFAQLARDYGALIVPVERRPEIGTAPRTPRFAQLTEQLRSEFGPSTEVRLGAREGRPIVWLRLSSSDQSYWVGLPAEVEPDRSAWRVTALIFSFLAILLPVAYWFARRSVQPLKHLASAASAIGRGQPAAPVPETGPAEIVAVARGFNQMSEDLTQLENERALMLAGVSHDIRTPLTRLKLELEMASLPDATKNAMALEIDEIDRTLGQFLDFAQGVHRERIPCSVFPVLPWLAERVARERERRGEVVTLDCDRAVMVYAHAPTLERALVNLIDNAFRYGSPSVNIYARSTDADLVTLEVADRGPGIAQDQIARLLRPFTRGNSARSNAGGAGLGLAIVRRIVEIHDGHLTISPREGGGTSVKIQLRARPA